MPAALATAAQVAAGSKRSMLPIGASATGIVNLRLRKVALVSVSLTLRSTRGRNASESMREPVAPHRGLGLRAADQVVPDVAVELGAGGQHELVQIVELLPDLVDAWSGLAVDASFILSDRDSSVGFAPERRF